MIEKDNSLLWLVREMNNRVHGPYTHQEILSQIKAGKIRNKVEIARANSYWFSLSEKEEVEKFFPEFTGTGTNTKDVTVTSLTTQTKTMGGSESVAHAVAPIPQASPPAEKTQWLSEEYEDDFGLNDLVAQDIPAANPPPAEEVRPQKTSSPISPSLVASTHKTAAPKNRMAEPPKKPLLRIAVAFLFLIALAISAFLITKKRAMNGATTAPVVSNISLPNIKTTSDYSQTLRKVFLLQNLEQVKRVITEMEAKRKADPVLAIAKSMMRRHFLFDAEGAYLELDAVRSLLSERNKLETEFENLSGIYLFDREPTQAINHFRSASTLNPSEKIYSLNLATAQFLSGRFAESEKVLQDLIKGAFTPEYLLPQLFVMFGQVLENTKSIADTGPEFYYKKALEFNPTMTEARLLLATRKLRRSGMKEAEADFRIFLESMADLDSGTGLINYRLLPLTGIYSRARNSMHQTNSVAMNAAAKPTPLFMAIDAILSIAENKYNEAERILDDGLGLAPGHADLIKAMAYLHWEEGKFTELLDLLKEIAKENRNSYAVHILMGRAYQKIGNYSAAEKSYGLATKFGPDQSDGWASWGEALANMKMDTEALQKFQTALQKDPFNLRAVQGAFRLGNEDVLNNERFLSLIPF